MKIELYRFINDEQEEIIVYWDTEETSQDPLAIQFIKNYCQNNKIESQEKEYNPEKTYNFRVTQQNYIYKTNYLISKNIIYKYQITHKRNGEVFNINYSLNSL